MKKVLFVVNHFRYSNGVAAALKSLITNLDPKKYDIHVLAVYEFDKEYAVSVMDKITVVPGFNRYFRGFDKIVDLIPGDILYHHFVKEKYDLEVAFQFGVPTRMIAMGDNPNRICWMHTYDNGLSYKRYYEKYKKVISVAQVGSQKMIHDGIAKEKSDYCYNVIDEENIYKQSSEPIEVEKTHQYAVITVARLSPDKAGIRYLECIRELVEKVSNSEFWIIGDGTERVKMETYVKEHNLGNVVKLLGLQKNPYKYLSKADLYFCASYREGFSTACQEAAILGIPVVSVDVDGAKELVELAGCGKVMANDKQSMVKELGRILLDENLIEDWKTNAVQAKERFYKDNRVRKADEILDEFLK